MKSFKDETEELIRKYGEDFNDEQRSFTVTVAEETVIQEWIRTLLPRIKAIQESTRKVIEQDDTILNVPDYGAIGGGIKYSFVPTSLGTILVVTEAITKDELNVTAALNFYGF